MASSIFFFVSLLLLLLLSSRNYKYQNAKEEEASDRQEPGKEETTRAAAAAAHTFECFLEIRSRSLFDAANVGQVERAVTALFVGGRHARSLHLVGRR